MYTIYTFLKIFKLMQTEAHFNIVETLEILKQ